MSSISSDAQQFIKLSVDQPITGNGTLGPYVSTMGQKMIVAVEGVSGGTSIAVQGKVLHQTNWTTITTITGTTDNTSVDISTTDQIQFVVSSFSASGTPRLVVSTFFKLASGGSGVAVWGSITGTLSNQVDLQNALNAKLSLSGGTMTGNLAFATGQEVKWPNGIYLGDNGSGALEIVSNNSFINLLTASGLGVFTSNNVLDDGSGNANVANTLSVGGQPTLNFAGGNIYLQNSAGAVVIGSLLNSVQTESGTTLDDGAGNMNLAGTLTINGGQSIYTGGLSYIAGNWIFQNAGGVSFSGGAPSFNSGILMSSSNVQFDSSSFIVDNSSNVSIEPDARLLVDSSANQSANWNGRTLSDSSSIKSVDWANRKLYDTTGSNVLLDWSGNGVAPFKMAITYHSGNYTLQDSDYCLFEQANSSTVTVPTAVGRANKVFIIKNWHGSGGPITLASAVSGQLEGVSSISMPQNKCYTIVSDNTQWNILSVY